MTRPTSNHRRLLVLKLLKTGGWHRTMDIEAVECGGSQGTRRLRELREEVEAGKHPPWLTIRKRKVKGSTQYEYRLSKHPPPPKEPSTEEKLKRRVRVLKKKIRQLEEELAFKNEQLAACVCGADED